MRLAAKILFTLAAALIVLAIAISVRATPMSDPSLLGRGLSAGIVAALVLPFAAMAILPWLARDDGAPAGIQFRGSTTLLILGTAFLLMFASLALALAIPVTMIVIGALQDTIDNRDWIMFGVALVSLPAGVLLILFVPYVLFAWVALPWRWRRWPIITIADDGLHVPGKSPLRWSSLAGTNVEITGARYPVLRITGPETRLLWPFGPQPVLRLGVMLMNYFGDRQGIADAITSHPKFPAADRRSSGVTHGPPRHIVRT